MTFGKRCVRLQDRREIVQAEHDGRDDPQRADGLVIARDDHLLDVFEFVEDLTRPLQVNLAGFGQRQASGGAIQKAGAEPAFEVGDVARRDRIRDVHRARRPGETAEIRDLDEHSHRLQMIHTPLLPLLQLQKYEANE